MANTFKRAGHCARARLCQLPDRSGREATLQICHAPECQGFRLPQGTGFALCGLDPVSTPGKGLLKTDKRECTPEGVIL